MRSRAERRVAARYRWDRLQVSFWFVPALMALAAVLLAWTMYCELPLHHVGLIRAESQVGDLIEQDRQAIQLSSQALQARLESDF